MMSGDSAEVVEVTGRTKGQMMEQLTRLKKVNWLVFPIIGIIVLFLLVGFSRWAYDDPFISYRYATNISRGLGFVYNPGERILSTTTPLFTLILAIGGLLITNLHLLATTIGVISLAIGGLFIFDLAKTLKTPLVGWVGLLLYPTFPLVVSTLGSETPLYLALCLGAFALYARGRYLTAGVLGALATLARPDGVIIMFILGMDYLIRLREPIPWKTIIVSGTLIFVWVIFAGFYFGSPIPVTLASKQQQGLMEISESFSRGFFTIIRSYATWPYFIEAILALVGLLYAVWRRSVWFIILIWPIIYFISYSLLGVSRYFWYYAPLIPGFVIAIGFGLSGLFDFLKDITREKESFSSVPILLSVIIMIILFTAQGRSLWKMRELNDPRLEIYRAVGEWLNENTLPNDKIGSLEVGIIGYYAQRPMIDFAGLIQPTVAKQFNTNTTYENSALWAIENLHPQYVILHDGLFNQVDHDLVERNCEVVKKIEGKPYSYSWDLMIYGCP